MKSTSYQNILSAKNLTSLVFLSATALFPNEAHATFGVYTNASTWSSAAGATPGYDNTLVETFSSVPANTFYANTSGSNVAFGPIAFNGFAITGSSNGDRFGIGTATLAGGDDVPIPAPFAGQNFLGWGSLDGSVGPTSTYTFSSPTYAFGFDWFNTDVTDTYSITVVSASGTSTYLNPPFSFTSSGFFGVTSTALISSATIQTSSFGGFISTEGLDNFRVASTVPEPSTSAMLALAGLGAFWHLRRRNP